MKNKELITTAPALAARLRFYQPTRRPIKIDDSGWIPVPWGRARVRSGKLGQRHADAVDAIIAVTPPARWEFSPSGQGTAWVDPAAIRRIIGRKQYSCQGLRSLLDDLMTALLDWIKTTGEKDAPKRTEKKEEAGTGHIIDNIFYDKDVFAESECRLPKRDKMRRLWGVQFSAAYIKLLAEDIRCRYDIVRVAGLTYGTSQAFARLALSHDYKKWPACGLRIDTVLIGVGVELGALRFARRRVRKDAGGLAGLGLVVEGDHVRFVTPR